MPEHNPVSNGASKAYLEIYLLISAVLLLPVLLWPSMLLTGMALNPGVDIAGHWRVASVALLVIATTADSMLYAHVDRPKSLISIAAWVIGMGLWGAWGCNEPDGHLILGFLFFIHASRSAQRLWHESNDWWLWTAWIRDTLACLALFLWPWYLA